MAKDLQMIIDYNWEIGGVRKKILKTIFLLIPIHENQ